MIGARSGIRFLVAAVILGLLPMSACTSKKHDADSTHVILPDSNHGKPYGPTCRPVDSSDSTLAGLPACPR